MARVIDPFIHRHEETGVVGARDGRQQLHELRMRGVGNRLAQMQVGRQAV